MADLAPAAASAGSIPAAGATGRVQAGVVAPGAAAAQNAPGGSGGDSLHLSAEAQALVAKLQSRDADVRAHEEAHLAAAGGLATSGATYSYERGPDGRVYAVGGEVSISTSPVRGNPEATLAKAQQIEAAALAPADPSPQDQSVASAAAAMAAQAASQLAQGRTAAGQGAVGVALSGEAGTYAPSWAGAGRREPAAAQVDLTA